MYRVAPHRTDFTPCDVISSLPSLMHERRSSILFFCTPLHSDFEVGGEFICDRRPCDRRRVHVVQNRVQLVRERILH